ncbi:hypothetical protein R0K17_29755, partial [Planococcus sp. SIMBA_143]
VIDQALEAKNYAVIIERLLLYYYDPRYEYKAYENEGNIINLSYESLEEGTQLVQNEIDRLDIKLRSEGEKVSL